MDINDYIGKFDLEGRKVAELEKLLIEAELDDCDRLIQLCDSLATWEGVVFLEERMQEVKERYGYYPQSKWDRNVELKEYFEKKAGKMIGNFG
ncbi:MAG: phosphohydrolase [Roseburia sp.]|nr:phosphohydrolase [Roseburia sp.]